MDTIDQGACEAVLYEAPRLRVVHRTGPFGRAPAVAVTFTTWVPDPRANLAKGFAEGVFLKAGIDEILVMNGRNDWYQAPEVSAAVGAVAAVLPAYARVISYGASMGGYACLNFSNRLKVDRCVAVSPQVSVDPRAVPFETRWQSDAARIRFTHDDVAGSLHPGTRHLIFYDPQSRDGDHARLIPGVSVQKIGLRHSGHFTLNTIKDLGLLGRFFRLVTGAEQDPAAFQAEYTRRISTSPWRIVGLAERSIRRPARLLGLWRRFQTAPPKDPVPYEKIALFLILARCHDQALETLGMRPALRQRPYAQSLRARALAGLGDATAARIEGRRVVEMLGPAHDYCRQLRSLGIIP
ncbi:MAG: hypothetical protein AAGB15_02335 [Pseudomonadota bacterium]